MEENKRTSMWCISSTTSASHKEETPAEEKTTEETVEE